MPPVDPRLPGNIGGSGGAHILKGRQAKLDEQQNPTPPPEPPWDKKNCYRIQIPLNGREFYFPHKSEDPLADLGATATGVALPRALEVKDGFGKLNLATTDPRAQHLAICGRIDFISVGFLLEVIEKPDWFDAHWKHAFGESQK